MGRTVMFSWEPIFIAAGAITGMRVCISMLLGGTLCWAVFVPDHAACRRHHRQRFPRRGAMDFVGGASCMVASGILGFFLQWRTALSALEGFATIVFPRRTIPIDRTGIH